MDPFEEMVREGLANRAREKAIQEAAVQTMNATRARLAREAAVRGPGWLARTAASARNFLIRNGARLGGAAQATVRGLVNILGRAAVGVGEFLSSDVVAAVVLAIAVVVAIACLISWLSNRNSDNQRQQNEELHKSTEHLLRNFSANLKNNCACAGGSRSTAFGIGQGSPGAQLAFNPAPMPAICTFPNCPKGRAA